MTSTYYAPEWFNQAKKDELPKQAGSILRPRLGFVMSDRVLTDPLLRLSDNDGVLDGAFWTVEPVDGGESLYSLRNATGFTFKLSDPPDLKTGSEIHVWKHDSVETVRCTVAPGDDRQRRADGLRPGEDGETR